MSGESVLVFGATGDVGGAAAQEAAERGCKVWLATRDPTKPISWLSKEKEEDGTYTRLRADFADPASLTEAVKKSGAKAVFAYLVQGISSKPGFQALKDAGVTWIVLLSSQSIYGDLTRYKPDSFISYHHAHGELELQDVGIPYASVRPGFFASNLFPFYIVPLKRKGEIDLLEPDKLKFDWIAPTNIGQVAGALLTQPKPSLKSTEPEIVYLYGPEFISDTEIMHKVEKAAGKTIKINTGSEEAYYNQYVESGIPVGIAKYLLSQFKNMISGELYGNHPAKWENEKGNILKYSGKQPITFDQYLDSVKSELQL